MKGAFVECEFNTLTKMLVLLAALSGIYGLATGIGIGLAIAHAGVLEQFLPIISPSELFLAVAGNLLLLTILVIVEAGDAVTVARQLAEEHFSEGNTDG